MDQFQADRLAAIQQEIVQAEALAALGNDPAFRAAQQRLSQLEIVAEGENLLRQLEQFPQLARQRRAKRRPTAADSHSAV